MARFFGTDSFEIVSYAADWTSLVCGSMRSYSYRNGMNSAWNAMFRGRMAEANANTTFTSTTTTAKAETVGKGGNCTLQIQLEFM